MDRHRQMVAACQARTALPMHHPPMVMATKSDTPHGNRCADHAGATNRNTPSRAYATAMARVSRRDRSDSDSSMADRSMSPPEPLFHLSGQVADGDGTEVDAAVGGGSGDGPVPVSMPTTFPTRSLTGICPSANLESFES